jgi:hypothetical protein
VDFAEAHEDEVLEQLAADAAGADHEDARLGELATTRIWERTTRLFDPVVQRAQVAARMSVALHDSGCNARKAWWSVRWGGWLTAGGRGRRKEDGGRRTEGWRLRSELFQVTGR